MKKLATIISSTEPCTKGALWAKPIIGGFALYLIDEGIITPLIPVDDNGTPLIDDDKDALKKKADKVTVGAHTDDIATLTSTGNLKSSGKTMAQLIADLPSGGFVYKGRLAVPADLPTSGQTAGDQYVVGTAGTYEGEALVMGDYLIWNGTAWDIYKQPQPEP